MIQKPKGHRYLQIAEELKVRIQKQIYPIGTQLPTEKEICDDYEVSRYTARSALKYLIDLQLIERRQGSGSVVVATEPPMIHKSFMQDIDDLWQYGNTTRFKIFDQAEIEKPEFLAENANGRYFRLLGNRFTSSNSDVPFCITQVYLWTDDSELSEDLLHGGQPARTLMGYLCPQNLQRVEQVLSARGLTTEEAEVLHGREQEAALCAQRKYFDNKNRHIATAINVHSGGQYEYATILHRKSS